MVQVHNLPGSGCPGHLVSGGSLPRKMGRHVLHCTYWHSVPVYPQFLPKNLHLVCVDMPGHEGTTRSSLDDLSIDGQVKRIHQVSRRLHQKLPRWVLPTIACPSLKSRQGSSILTQPFSKASCLQVIANKMAAAQWCPWSAVEDQGLLQTVLL